MVSSLRTWFDYLIEVEKVELTNPARSVAKSKLPKRHANALTATEVVTSLYITIWLPISLHLSTLNLLKAWIRAPHHRLGTRRCQPLTLQRL